jgi:hypothetical protein
MFELIYDVKYSDIIYEYYDIYKDGKPYYKDKRLSYLLSLQIDRCSETIQFVNVTDEIYIEISSDRRELYKTILSLCDELDIKDYKVIGKDLLSKELYYILE